MARISPPPRSWRVARTNCPRAKVGLTASIARASARKLLAMSHWASCSMARSLGKSATRRQAPWPARRTGRPPPRAIPAGSSSSRWAGGPGQPVPGDLQPQLGQLLVAGGLSARNCAAKPAARCHCSRPAPMAGHHQDFAPGLRPRWASWHSSSRMPWKSRRPRQRPFVPGPARPRIARPASSPPAAAEAAAVVPPAVARARPAHLPACCRYFSSASRPRGWSD